MLILTYIFDSLRRDFLGCYGDAGTMTPHLDRFAAQATRFRHAYAAAAWSKASGAALLTGELPRAVRMRALLDSLPAEVPTLAERLQAKGFSTVAVSANPFISHDFGLLRGFEQTVEAFRPGVLPSESALFHANHFRRLADSLSVDPSALVLARSEALHSVLLDLIPTNEPTFALCWSMDTHAPFFVRGDRSYFGNPLERVIPAADPEWLTGGLSVRDIVRLYRDMIAYNDAHFGALMRILQERGQWEDALVIVAADHGEAFGEHQLMGHTNGLWEEQITVPLLVKWPRQSVSRICDTPVSLVDIGATISQVIGLPLFEHSDLSGKPLTEQPP
ncbi:MAG: sulfatase, partial [Ardenticatenaceae bacterium]